MGNEAQQVAAKEFILANVGGKFLKFKLASDLPKEVPSGDVITHETVSELTKDQISEIYGKVAGVGKKNFKDKKVAIESLVYQVAKMPTFDPNASPLAEAVKAGTKANKPAGKAPKSPDTFELLQPQNTDEVLRGLAPQARELVLIMVDLAKEVGSTKFGGEKLEEKLKVPEVAARLRTRQDPMRILQYYKGKLIGSGLIRVS